MTMLDGSGTALTWALNPGACQILIERVALVVGCRPELRSVLLERVVAAEADEAVVIVCDGLVARAHRKAAQGAVGLVIDGVPDRELNSGTVGGVLWSCDKSQPMRLSTSQYVLLAKVMLEAGVIVYVDPR